jgi:hypothetical protein
VFCNRGGWGRSLCRFFKGAAPRQQDVFDGAVSERSAPRIAVISVGAGIARGHRPEEVVDRYDQDSVRLLRTDRDGAVTAMSDGRRILVSGFADATTSQTVAQARH